MSENTSTPLPKRLQDLSGRKYGRLTVIRFFGWHTFPKSRRESMWECLCDCGNKTVVYRNLMVKHHTRSCGCLERENRYTVNVTHGGTIEGKREPIYDIWLGMRQRCNDKNCRNYRLYGARGIRVEWESYEDFRRDMMPTYRKGLTIDRINNDGPYSKCNCRWATNKEQCNNKRNNRRIEHGGQILTLKQWSEKLGIRYPTLQYHILLKGRTMDDALSRISKCKNLTR